MVEFKLNLELLERLCNSFGPTGFEDETQKLVKEYGKKYADKVTHDGLRSVIFEKKGSSDRPKIMLAGHSDEIGFIITSIEKNGFLKFHQLGGWWDQTLLSQQVVIKPFKGEKPIIGIIAAKPPHLLTPEEAKKVVTKDKMFIDIGCKSKEEVEALGIRVGDPAVPYSSFRLEKRVRRKKNGNSSTTEQETMLAIGKAFDDRIGVFIMLEILCRLSEENIEHPNTVFGVSTTQEEVGLRGARTAAQKILPDVGFSLDVDISGDVPGTDLNQKMGEGVCISAGDSSMIPNPRFRRFVIEIAEEKGIKYQTSFLKRGGTDAGIIHLTGVGAPSLFIGISTRHIHSHNGILDLSDVENAIQLLIEVIKRLDHEKVNTFTKI